MPSRADVNFLLTAVKAQFINADQAKQVYEAHQKAEQADNPPLIHQTAQSMGLLDTAQAAKVQRLLLAVDSDEGKDAKQKKKVTQIADFRLHSKLGEGAMGVVYKATQSSTGREVAIKVLLRKFQEDRKYLERFKREYTNASRLEHPNIIEFVDAGQAPKEQGGYYYFAMEYVDGQTLQQIIDDRGHLPEKEAIRVATEIGKALSHAHQLNIKHRDIKPDNIMITREGVVKLTDLGLAKEVLDSSVTQAGMTIGTPHYMSPEQARGQELDNRSDLYSLGATLYHLLTGHPPFEGKSAAVVMMKHIEEQIPSPKEIRPELSDNISMVISKMMAKELQDRYPEAESLVTDLENVIGDKAPMQAMVSSSESSVRMPAMRDIPAPAPAPEAAPAPVATPQPAPTPEPEAAPASSGPSPALIGGIAAGVVLLLFVLFMILRTRGGG